MDLLGEHDTRVWSERDTCFAGSGHPQQWLAVVTPSKGDSQLWSCPNDSQQGCLPAVAMPRQLAAVEDAAQIGATGDARHHNFITNSS